MVATPDTTTLIEWLNTAIDNLPDKGQIVLNFDGNTVQWEVKAAYVSRDRNGDHERIEVKRFGRLVIQRRNQAEPTRIIE